MKKRYIIGGIILLGGIVGFMALKKAPTVETAVNQAAVKVEKRMVESTIRVSGTVKSESTASVYPEVDGQIKTLEVKEGQKVKKGDLLLTLDNEQLVRNLELKQISLETEEARLEQMKKRGNFSLIQNVQTAKETVKTAEASLEKKQKLYESGSISLETLEEAKKSVKNAEEALNVAEHSLAASDYDSNLYIQQKSIERLQKEINQANKEIKKAEVKSIIEGTVIELNKKVDDKVTVSTEVMKIQDLDNTVIETFISENDISKISVGQSVIITANAIKNKKMEGTVTYIAPSTTIVQGKKQAYTKIKVTPNQSESSLKPNFSTNLVIQTQKNENALAVKFEAVFTKEDGQKYVNKVLDNGETEMVDVTVGIEGDIYVEVISDKLKEGDELMVNLNGDAVNVSNINF